MPDHRRIRVPGGTGFLTINLPQRRGNALLTERIDLLRDAVRRVRREWPFGIDAPGRPARPSALRLDLAARRRRAAACGA